MQNQLRGRALADRLNLIDEVDKSRSPSYFEWREQTVTTKAFQPVKPQPKAGPITRLLRRFV